MSVNTHWGAPWGGHTQGSREELWGWGASKVGRREVLKSGGLTGESGLGAGDGGWPPGSLAGEVEKC